MTMRRTIGLSLAFLVISAAAMGASPEKGTSRQIAQPLAAKPQKAETQTGRIGKACDMTRAPATADASERTQHRLPPNATLATPDSHRGSVHSNGPSQIGKAAWYGLVGNYTANGERLDTVTATAAHRSLPLSSYARVTSLDNGRSVIVKINDRGPQPQRFIIDLSPRAADELDMRSAGVASVIVEPVVFERAMPAEAAPTTAAFYYANND
jgi:rare lipoprotein A